MAEENIAEIYLNKLQDEPNPGALLTRFYMELFVVPFSQPLIATMNRLIRVFGREIVFYSILSLESSKELDHNNIYALLRFICAKKLEAKNKPTNELQDLTEHIKSNRIKSEKTRVKTMKVRSPFED